MKRCTSCGFRWCTCPPNCASIDYFSALDLILVSRQGPQQRGTDAAFEILESAADIVVRPEPEWSQHIDDLAAAYPPTALAEALLYALERLGGSGPRAG
jgi:hypothetical protein